MILILSNRDINLQGSGVEIFQPCINPEGSAQVLLAEASPSTNQDWRIKLLPSSPPEDWLRSDLCTDTFGRLIRQMLNHESGSQPESLVRNEAADCYTWVVFVPGYTSNPKDSLAKARDLEQAYKVNVILFSWPADPSGLEPDRYFKARDAARFSATKLKLALEHLNQIFIEPARQRLDSQFRVCMLMHSLGNKVFEKLVLSEGGAQLCSTMDTIILHQPDVDSEGTNQWVPQVKPKEKLYLTVNEHDAVLMISNLVNKTRLGIFPGDLLASSSPKLEVIDFTEGHYVAKAHWLFTDFENQIVHLICDRMLNGTPGGGPINTGLDTVLPHDDHSHQYKLGTGLAQEHNHPPDGPHR